MLKNPIFRDEVISQLHYVTWSRLKLTSKYMMKQAEDLFQRAPRKLHVMRKMSQLQQKMRGIKLNYDVLENIELDHLTKERDHYAQFVSDFKKETSEFRDLLEYFQNSGSSPTKVSMVKTLEQVVDDCQAVVDSHVVILENLNEMLQELNEE